MVRVDGDALTGTVVAIRDPFYGPGETGAEGAPRLDDENPDPALRTRPVVGLSILLDFAWDGRRWQGRIYDPESGNTYQSRLKVNGDGELEIRGYIGSPMFGRTAIFEPASDCPEATALMLAKSAVDDVCPVAAD